MENAVEALKTVFAVTVFAVALTVLFRMTALAKDTADMIFMAIDETTFMNYKADPDEGGNRVVTFQEIMPTIYRYAQEGYGVTIIENGRIVARFDLDTESQVSSCFWTDERYIKASQSERDKSDKIKQEIIDYINKYIADNVYGVENIDDIDSLNELIKKLYGTGNVTNPVYTGWLKSNTYKDNYITQRVNCDIYGGTTNFSLVNQGVNETDPTRVDGTHKAVNGGIGLLELYQDVTGNGTPNFTEYIIEIDKNEYIADEDGENTGLLVFGTLRNTKKREIVYVKN